MYVLVNYKSNTRLKETYRNFMDAFNFAENMKDKDIKIEYWDFKDNSCKLVWTDSYNSNVLCGEM